MPYNEYNDPTPIATVEQFKQALLTVRDTIGISQQDSAMLKAHCSAHEHTISSNPVHNLQYGALAHHVADALGITLRPTHSGEPHWWRTLAIGHDPLSKDASYEWIMRPELVKALQEMKWVRAEGMH